MAPFDQPAIQTVGYPSRPRLLAQFLGHRYEENAAEFDDGRAEVECSRLELV